MLFIVDHSDHRLQARHLDLPVAGVELRRAGDLRALDLPDLHHMVRAGRDEQKTEHAHGRRKKLVHKNSFTQGFRRLTIKPITVYFLGNNQRSAQNHNNCDVCIQALSFPNLFNCALSIALFWGFVNNNEVIFV